MISEKGERAMSLAPGVLSGLLVSAGAGVGLVGAEWVRISLGVEQGLRLGLSRSVVMVLGVGVAGGGVGTGVLRSTGVNSLVEVGLRGSGVVGLSASQVGLAVELGLSGATFVVQGFGLPVVGGFSNVSPPLLIAGGLIGDMATGLRGVGITGPLLDMLSVGLGLGLEQHMATWLCVGAVVGGGGPVPATAPLPLRVVG